MLSELQVRRIKAMSQPIYDAENIFAKILRGEIPCNKVDECDHTLSFHDIQPQAPVHVLVIPKGAYVNMTDFSENAPAEAQAAYIAALGRVAKMVGVTEDGYRLIANTGTNGHQDVPHLHVHIMGGQPLGRMMPSTQ
jgi:diadenosine tetraphosphate (Ap4A) HIT family hydrolase